MSLEHDPARSDPATATSGSSGGPPDTTPRTISVPEAGRIYLGLGRDASYEAAKRGEIPFIQIGRLKRVPIVVHTSSGRHVAKEVAFPKWVPAEILAEAGRLSEGEALRNLGGWCL